MDDSNGLPGDTVAGDGPAPDRPADEGMSGVDAEAIAFALLAASRALVDNIHMGVAERGFSDIRPAAGFAFSLLSAGGATTSELAAHLGVTKQAAAQFVGELAAKGYVRRGSHPDDARARLIVLTDKGWACTRAAQAATADAVRAWARTLGGQRLSALAADLLQVAPRGPLRPSW